jgi:hypothetical protein
VVLILDPIALARGARQRATGAAAAGDQGRVPAGVEVA